jgi:hypothetical protein
MDITQGDTAGRDRLRAFLRAPTSIPDADMQQMWDAAVGTTRAYIRPGYDTDSPEETILFVLAVANHLWQATKDAGGVETMIDGTQFTPYAVTGNLVKRYLSIGGDTVGLPRTTAGGTYSSGVTW